MESLKDLLRQPYWVIALIFGVALVAFPFMKVDQGRWSTQPPSSIIPIWIGLFLLVLSSAGFWLNFLIERAEKASTLGAGVDLGRVREDGGSFWTKVGGCEIRVTSGRIEEFGQEGVAVALPCNEYFDDRCIGDKRSALGAYVNRAFEGQIDDFVTLTKNECEKKLGAGVEQQKTADEVGVSLGAGRCVLLAKPLGRSVPIALISTTTQRAGQGLTSRVSYLFDGMREMVTRLADARLNEVVMPILGAGHGGIDPPLALVGLLLAIAESTHYRQEGHRLKRVTVVVFQRDADSTPEVDKAVVQRALALIGSRE